MPVFIANLVGVGCRMMVSFAKKPARRSYTGTRPFNFVASLERRQSSQ
jgi:hypothetical protein